MSTRPLPTFTPDAEHRFFIYDAQNGEHSYFATAAERDQYAEYVISLYLDDGWDEMVEQVIAGELTHLTHQVGRVERPPAEEIDKEGYDREGRRWEPSWTHYCDYALLPLEAPAESCGACGGCQGACQLDKDSPAVPA